MANDGIYHGEQAVHMGFGYAEVLLTYPTAQAQSSSYWRHIGGLEKEEGITISGPDREIIELFVGGQTAPLFRKKSTEKMTIKLKLVEPTISNIARMYGFDPVASGRIEYNVATGLVDINMGGENMDYPRMKLKITIPRESGVGAGDHVVTFNRVTIVDPVDMMFKDNDPSQIELTFTAEDDPDTSGQYIGTWGFSPEYTYVVEADASCTVDLLKPKAGATTTITGDSFDPTTSGKDFLNWLLIGTSGANDGEVREIVAISSDDAVPDPSFSAIPVDGDLFKLVSVY